MKIFVDQLDLPHLISSPNMVQIVLMMEVTLGSQMMIFVTIAWRAEASFSEFVVNMIHLDNDFILTKSKICIMLDLILCDESESCEHATSQSMEVSFVHQK